MKALNGGTYIKAGKKKYTPFSPIVLVQTSDEVEPRDIIVTTAAVGPYVHSSNDCKIKRIEVVAEGSTLEVLDLK